MKIGVYGGSFNPPHLGHVRAAQACKQALGLDRVLVIPASIPPHKQLTSSSASPEERLALTRLAFENLPGFEVLDLEIRREGKSYTVDTIRELKAQYEHDELFLMMGTDMFLSLSEWKEPETIVRAASPAVMYRGDPGEEAEVLHCKREWEDKGVCISVVKNPVIAISSTQLRRMLIFHCAAPFLPESVADYISKNGLYAVNEDLRRLPMERLEPLVISLLNPNRVNHVMGCRDTAEKLALRWGADPVIAARAGILHDITKALDGPLQLTLCREYGTILDDFGQRHPKTLHALTGSLVARRIFGEPEQVVSAIRHHTTGKADMTLMEKIIYVADYMEPCRNFPGVDRLRELAFSDLDGALRLGLEMTLENLKSRREEISPESWEALEFLKGSKAPEKG